jgi:hypothetical protein
MAIGASGYNNYTGYIKVYCTKDDGGNRLQLGQIIYGNAANDWFGFSVDDTTNTMTIICGSPGKIEDNDRPGYMTVFTLDGADNLGMDIWNQIGQDIIGKADGDGFGQSVSISEDGKMIVVGATNNDGNDGADLGHIRIYCLVDDGMSWVQIGQDINGAESGDNSGSLLSLSADGSTVAIRAPRNGNNGDDLGQVMVY